MENNFEVLVRKDIIQILDGDETLGEDGDLLFRMPYLTGWDLVELSKLFGLNQEYGDSRWTYLYNLLKYVIEQNKCDELLRYMFDLERFNQLEELKDPSNIVKMHQEICKTAIDRINTKLVLGRHKLQFIEGHFYVTKIGKRFSAELQQLKKMDSHYVQGLYERCQEDFVSANYDSVITKSRTIMEEVLIFILERRNIEIPSNGNLSKLYNQVKAALNMHQNNSFDGRVNSLLSGLEKIVDAIASLRNSNSDAHGAGSTRIQIKEREARLIMNSSISFCEYILSVDEQSK